MMNDIETVYAPSPMEVRLLASLTYEWRSRAELAKLTDKPKLTPHDTRILDRLAHEGRIEARKYISGRLVPYQYRLKA